MKRIVDFVRNVREERGITGLEVVKENAHIQKGKIVEYRATLLVTFVLDK